MYFNIASTIKTTYEVEGKCSRCAFISVVFSDG